MRHAHSTRMLEQLKVTDRFSTPGIYGAQVLAKGPVHPDGEGSYAWAYVLHTNPGNDYHPFAVRPLHYNDDSDTSYAGWQGGGGDYCRDLTTGLEVFEARTGTKERRR